MKTTMYKFHRTLLLLFFLTAFKNTYAQKTDIDIDPNQRYQVFDGWGASLSWWANFTGGWPEEDIDMLVNDLTSPEELNMNVWKYNLHAGDNPEPHSPGTERTLPDGSTTHLRWESLPIKGYKASPSAHYDWTANANQRKVLRKILERRPDAILDAISYSPPYWMTISGCSGGGTIVNGRGTPNLADENIEPYADYLSDIIKHYHDSFGITFSSVSAFNEAFNTNWKFGGSTEGNVATVPTLKKTYEALYQQLQAKRIKYCGVNALDESSINAALDVFNQFAYDDSFISKLSRMNTHSYAGFARSGLSDVAQTNDLKIWQSEFGGNVGSGTRTYIHHAERIIEDVEDMHVNAWLIWQVVSGGPWGMYDYDFNDDRPTTGVKSTRIFKNKVYFSVKQFSKYIKPGYQIIRSEDKRTLAALSPDKKELVVVMVNRETTSQNKQFNLSKFTSTGPAARVIRTSVTENTATLSDIPIDGQMINYSAPPESVTTFIIPVNTPEPYEPLADGLYTIQVKHSGKYMSVDEAPSGSFTFISQNDLENTDRFRFVVERRGYDYEIRPVADDQFLTIVGRSENNGTRLIEYDYRGFDNQRFYIVPDGDTGYYKIINKNSNLYLAVSGSNNQSNGGDIVQYQDYGSGNFRWKFEPVDESIELANGEYVIKAVHSQKCMAVEDRASNNGALIEQREYFKKDSLSFDVTRGLDGYYQIKPTYNEKVLTTPANTANANGKTVSIFSNIHAINQKFKLTAMGNNTFTISPKNNPTKVLGVEGAGQSNGNHVVLWDDLGTDNFRWVFEKKVKKPKPEPGLQDDELVSIYPNPTSGELFLKKTDTTAPLYMEIYEQSSGIEVDAKTLTEETTRIELPVNAKKGAYIFRFTDGDIIFWRRIILK